MLIINSCYGTQCLSGLNGAVFFIEYLYLGSNLISSYQFTKTVESRDKKDKQTGRAVKCAICHRLPPHMNYCGDLKKDRSC